MRQSGVRLAVLALGMGLALSGCVYGFAGGGLPANIKTVAVLPFDNQTAAPMLQRELYDALRKDVEGRLGLNEAAEGKADAIVKGTIVRYDADIPVAYSADPSRASTAQRKLQITVDVEIIDQITGRTLWQQKGLVGDGTYAQQAESDGRKAAIQKIVDAVLAGAQSQW